MFWEDGATFELVAKTFTFLSCFLCVPPRWTFIVVIVSSRHYKNPPCYVLCSHPFSLCFCFFLISPEPSSQFKNDDSGKFGPTSNISCYVHLVGLKDSDKRKVTYETLLLFSHFCWSCWVILCVCVRAWLRSSNTKLNIVLFFKLLIVQFKAMCMKRFFSQ